jgi:adenine-specific DNA-methyltransferase
VVGNPPYIRQEWLAPFKPYWEERYRSYHGVADIFVYFFEQGELLRPGGQLAFITSGSWVRGNFGAPMRKFLSTNARISMVDFGEFQPFEDAEMIRPTIAIVEKAPPGGDMHLFKWLTSGRPPETLSDVLADAPTLNAARLGTKTWELEHDSVIALREKLSLRGTALHKYASVSIYRGVLSGLTEAYVIGRSKRDELVPTPPATPSSARSSK